jgi:guanylate kinase
MSIVYIVSAPSGSGKSTLVNELFKMVPHLHFSISYTTRPPRGSEKKKIPQAVSIFILPPDRENLEWRLRSRGLDAEDEICRRLDTARREIENYSKYDYILVNKVVEQSADQLRDIVLSERLQRSAAELSAEEKRRVDRAQACRLEQARERVQPILASFNPQVAKGR